MTGVLFERPFGVRPAGVGCGLPTGIHGVHLGVGPLYPVRPGRVVGGMLGGSGAEHGDDDVGHLPVGWRGLAHVVEGLVVAEVGVLFEVDAGELDTFSVIGAVEGFGDAVGGGYCRRR